MDSAVKPPLVSIVMSVYNSEEYLRETMESILAQTFKDFEFIVINDGSKDGSLSIIKSFDDPRIRLISRPNKGMVYSFNEGISLAKGKYIARHDSDDLSMPERLEKQVAYLESHPEVGLLGSNYRIVNQKGEFIIDTRVFTHPDDLKVSLVLSNQMGHGTVMMRTDLVRKAGAYDKDAFTEDYDLWTRLSRVTKVANLPEPLYVWRHSPTNFTNNNQDRALEATWAIRDREFKHLLKQRRDYRLFAIHPDGAGYFEKKAAVYRDLAWLYRRSGRLISAVAMQCMAIFCQPAKKRNYRHMLWLFDKKAFEQNWKYEYV